MDREPFFPVLGIWEERVGGSFFLLLILLLLLVFFLLFFPELVLGLVHVEAFMGLFVEEDPINVQLASPAPMAAHAMPVGEPEHGLSVHHPFRPSVVVGTMG